MDIAGMVKSSLVDYPGLIACTLFVPGCNYDCFYCHNRPLIRGPVKTLSLDSVFAFLRKRTGQLDGVVVTGGEPTLRGDLIPFLKDIKALHYHIKLDTNGSRPRVIEQALKEGLCDYVAVDYKAPADRYAEICGNGADADTTLQTIHLLQRHKARFEVRTTVIPQLKLPDLLKMACELPVLPRYVLNRYRKPETYLPRDEARVNETPYAQNQIEEFAQVLIKYQPHITV